MAQVIIFQELKSFLRFSIRTWLMNQNPCETETIATLPGGWELAHAIRLGIKPFAELGANLETLSGSQVDSPCSGRAIFESAPVAMLQSRETSHFLAIGVLTQR